MSKKIDKKLWGVLGKQQTYYSPQQFLQGKTKVPLNANPFDSWDMKRSRFYRVDGYENAVQQGGTVIGQTPAVTSSPIAVTPTTTPSITPTQTITPSSTPVLSPSETPTSTPTPTITPSTTAIIDCYWNLNDANWNEDSTLWNDCINVPSPTPSPTQTNTPSVSPTNTLTPTPSVTPSVSPTTSVTPTVTNTPTKTVTPTPSSTPAPFLPNSISNLQHWYRSDSGATASSWTNFGLLGGSVNQGNSARQPDIISATLGTSFTGNTMRFLNRDFMTGSFTSTNFSAVSAYFVWDVQTIDTSYGWNMQVVNCWAQNTIGATTEKRPTKYTKTGRTNTYYLGVSSGDTSFFTASFNDSIGTSASTNTFSGTTSTGFNFGFEPGATTSNATYIYEVLIYNKILSSTEHSNVINYLKTKYKYSGWTLS